MQVNVNISFKGSVALLFARCNVPNGALLAPYWERQAGRDKVARLEKLGLSLDAVEGKTSKDGESSTKLSAKLAKAIQTPAVTMARAGQAIATAEKSLLGEFNGLFPRVECKLPEPLLIAVVDAEVDALRHFLTLQGDAHEKLHPAALERLETLADGGNEVAKQYLLNRKAAETEAKTEAAVATK